MKKDYFLYLVALVQIVGGLLGFYYIYATYELSPNLLLTLGRVLVFSLSIYAGIELYRLSFKGYKLSLINLWMQTIGIGSTVFAYQYYSCFAIYIGRMEGRFFSYIFNSNWHLSFAEPVPLFTIAVNVVPVAFLYFLTKNKAMFLNAAAKTKDESTKQ